MNTFAVHSITGHGALGLSFEILDDRLVCIGEYDGLPDLIVQAFDPAHDIFYKTPGALTPIELEEETQIHVPASLREQVDRWLLASMLGQSVLMQFAETLAPAISPLSALRIILEPLGGVNSAILEANNGGICMVHRVAELMESGLTAHSLLEFLEASPEVRSSLLPDFAADTIFVSGADVNHIETFDFGNMIETRRIGLQEFASVCDFTEQAARHIGEAPYYYTLAIGAARVFHQMMMMQ